MNSALSRAESTTRVVTEIGSLFPRGDGRDVQRTGSMTYAGGQQCRTLSVLAVPWLVPGRSTNA